MKIRSERELIQFMVTKVEVSKAEGALGGSNAAEYLRQVVADKSHLFAPHELRRLQVRIDGIAGNTTL